MKDGKGRYFFVQSPLFVGVVLWQHRLRGLLNGGKRDDLAQVGVIGSCQPRDRAQRRSLDFVIPNKIVARAQLVLLRRETHCASRRTA